MPARARKSPSRVRTNRRRLIRATPARESINDPAWRRDVERRLARWYAKHARDLPWRRATDPFHIWVSEVMLQQTQVSTVVPYFARFIERFPTVESLAAAPLDDVLKLWQGLGYYRRAVNLHRAAKVVVERRGRRVPSELEALRELPGVGRYMAGAIRSFAFDLPAAIVEANTGRVLARLFAVRGPLGDAATQARIWELAESLVPRREPGRHNQALTELGALVCVSGQPRCEVCPLESHCRARQLGVEGEVPELKARREFVDVEDAAVVVRHRGRVLIVQRPPHARWGGLWELPRVTVAPDRDPRDAIADHVRRQLCLAIHVGRKVLTVRHGVTHHRIVLSCFEATLASGRATVQLADDARWELPERLGDYAVSSPQRKLIAWIQGRIAAQPELF